MKRLEESKKHPIKAWIISPEFRADYRASCFNPRTIELAISRSNRIEGEHAEATHNSIEDWPKQRGGYDTNARHDLEAEMFLYFLVHQSHGAQDASSEHLSTPGILV